VGLLLAAFFGRVSTQLNLLAKPIASIFARSIPVGSWDHEELAEWGAAAVPEPLHNRVRALRHTIAARNSKLRFIK
jgi:hypothetical protein